MRKPSEYTNCLVNIDVLSGRRYRRCSFGKIVVFKFLKIVDVLLGKSSFCKFLKIIDVLLGKSSFCKFLKIVDVLLGISSFCKFLKIVVLQVSQNRRCSFGKSSFSRFSLCHVNFTKTYYVFRVFPNTPKVQSLHKFY